MQKVVKTYSDADWAGCKQSRKSTTGGCIAIGTHIIKGWSKTQSLIALSSAESELYAILKASAETLGVMAMMKDLGYSERVNLGRRERSPGHHPPPWAGQNQTHRYEFIVGPAGSRIPEIKIWNSFRQGQPRGSLYKISRPEYYQPSREEPKFPGPGGSC